MSEQQLFTLKIAGKEYTIRSADEPDRIRAMAVHTDRKITGVMQTSLVSRENAAVITALSFADELLRLQDEITQLRRELLAAKPSAAKAAEEKEQTAQAE